MHPSFVNFLQSPIIVWVCESCLSLQQCLTSSEILFLQKNLWINKNYVWQQMPVIVDYSKASQVVQGCIKIFPRKMDQFNNFKTFFPMQIRFSILSSHFLYELLKFEPSDGSLSRLQTGYYIENHFHYLTSNSTILKAWILCIDGKDDYLATKN